MTLERHRSNLMMLENELLLDLLLERHILIIKLEWHIPQNFVHLLYVGLYNRLIHHKKV